MKDRIDRIADDIIEQIIDMMETGYTVGGEHRILPMVSSYSELHDYFDANVGWGEEWDRLWQDGMVAHDLSAVNAVTDRVDAVLRKAAGA